MKCQVGEAGPRFSFADFTAKLERWALDFLLLISPVPTYDFEFRNLQVRSLAKSILFVGLHFEFGHP